MSSSASTTASAISPATRRSILLLSFACFASMAAQRICDAMLPELSRVFSVGLAQAAQVVSVFAIAYGAAQLFYGPLGDRVGKFRVITFATLACSIGSALAVAAGTLDMLVFARLLMALGAAALIPLSMAWVGDSVPSDQLQEMLTRTGLGSTLGIVGGQLVGGLLTDALGWRWAFVFMTVLFGVVGSLLWLNLRQQRTPAAKVEAPVGATAVRPGFVTQALLILTGSWSRIILLMALVEGAAGFGVLAIWASHLHRSLGLSLSLAGAIVALFGLGGMLYMAVGRHLIRRFGQQGLVLFGGAIVGVCALVLAYTPHWGPALPASLLAGFGFFMFHNTMQTNATQMAPHARGTAVSLFSSSLFLGQSIGVVLAASLIDRVGTSAVIAAGGAVMALEGVYFAWVLRRRERMMKD
ncbi:MULTISPECIES: MFS transporter [unclassified Polaromonas]|jgi:predicted MFS family arabinose efflux permease|uniref:MFS transporter n=1 Tax=unclassified Polaromonas TaxID=2638319 RepID=UPI0018C8DC7A|nr:MULTISPECIES: MFS transporter [unclassified Polaromonas]MBG6072016.1 putative MFS family arabinose efflux permease [Polaromonas sp. CG_9.7]MBG6114019.1 putative MFS family arabinose efflux permease [Polaromonas sp. CG_9.2]